MGRARVVRQPWLLLWPLGSAPARRLRPVPEQPSFLRRAAVRAERTVHSSRMSSHCHTSAVLVVFMALAAGVGAEPLSEKSCDVVGDESTESQMEKALLKKLEPLSQIRFNTTVEIGTTENYAYHFRVCREVNSSLHDFAGLVQMDRQSGKTTVIGRINETQVFNGSDWIMLIYKGGDSYGRHCSGEKRRAVIMISCKRGITASSFSIISEEREKEQDCFYLFEMDSSVACPAEDSHLSTGSILLITFSALVTVYIVGGFLYQRLIVGAKGMEQFPHFAFWQDLGNLVADGCDFVCRSKPRNVPAAYRGVGDDQLGDESEERDDHLLPM
ncbi:cation-dependent mannose-6-phosphate receptor isoform X1 [Gallus gallus]|uniref:Cation-dependent mannose-6-phosphate receptor n=1 Tax=Gallus gallus TaxID=9031 RepID=A0A1L1RMY8_CHICK|nr:cation-dependent mannose-6-phosphate receptor isoform X1 [Gallus gallus]XP_416477.3 cation-dependent mannose-6-phosphate receptor isoform X1 [Gallus gallus]|eukprot:XP_416477.3 cation-dependent mannose-6-phosphate receptor isoform X2 [Gallus gallus]